jgi:hypothetical protein
MGLGHEKVIPDTAHPTISVTQSALSQIPSDDFDPLTFIFVGNICRGNFDEPSEVRLFLVQGILESNCFEGKGDDKRPRGVCKDPRSDGVCTGDVRNLNDGTCGLIVAVGIVDNSKLSPFTFLFWDTDSKKISLF